MAYTQTYGYFAPPNARGTVTATGDVVPSGADTIRYQGTSYGLYETTDYPQMSIPSPVFDTVYGGKATYGRLPAGAAALAANAAASINAATGVITAGGTSWKAATAMTPTTTAPVYGWLLRTDPVDSYV